MEIFLLKTNQAALGAEAFWAGSTSLAVSVEHPGFPAPLCFCCLCKHWPRAARSHRLVSNGPLMVGTVPAASGCCRRC